MIGTIKRGVFAFRSDLGAPSVLKWNIGTVFHCIFSLFIIFFTSFKSASAERKINPTEEVLLSYHKSQALEKDLPIGDIAFGPQSSLWAVGREFVWRWSVNKGNLQKIALPFSGKRLCSGHCLYNSENFIFLATSSDLYRIDSSTNEVFRFQVDQKGGKSIGIVGHGKKIFWLRQRRIYELSTKSTELRTLSRSQVFSDKSVTQIVLHSNPTTFVGRTNRIVERVVLGTRKKLKRKKILRTKFQIENLFSSEDTLYVNTKFTVLRLDHTGAIVQTIPVQGDRRIVGSEINDQAHTYLFSDRLLEVYNLRSEQTTYFRPTLGRVKKAGKITSSLPFVGVILDGRPRIFRLSGRWAKMMGMK